MNDEKWINVPDINGDGYSDLPIMERFMRRSIYSSHSDDFPLIFDIEMMPMGPPNEMGIGIESTRPILQYIEKPSPGLRIMSLNETRVRTSDNGVRIIIVWAALRTDK